MRFFALAKSQNNFTFSHQNIFQIFTVIKSYAPCFSLHFISFRIPKDMILYQFDQRKFYLNAKYFLGKFLVFSSSASESHLFIYN